MNNEEPSLLGHLDGARDGPGISTIIFAGKMRQDSDAPSVLDLHRRIVEDEVNEEGANITGLLMVQGNSIMHLLEGPSYSVVSGRTLVHVTYLSPCCYLSSK